MIRNNSKTKTENKHFWEQVSYTFGENKNENNKNRNPWNLPKIENLYKSRPTLVCCLLFHSISCSYLRFLLLWWELWWLWWRLWPLRSSSSYSGRSASAVDRKNYYKVIKCYALNNYKIWLLLLQKLISKNNTFQFFSVKIC